MSATSASPAAASLPPPTPTASSHTRAGEAVVRLVPLALIVVLIAHYPASIARRSSLDQYFNGVYRSRVLARELILGIANAFDRLVGAGGAGPSPGFATGWVAVTGGGFLLAWWLLGRHRRGRALSLGPLEVVVTAAMAVSATTLTPYDFLSYALMVATVVAAESGKTVVTAVLAAAAVATRESGLLATVTITATCVAPGPDATTVTHPGPTGLRRSFWRTARRHHPLWAAGGASVTTYLVLKLVLRTDGGLNLFQHVRLGANLNLGSAWAIALAAALVAAGRLAVGPAGPTLALRRRALWMLAAPYLVVLAIGSGWGEAPRLVMPLVLGEALLAIGAVALDRARPSVLHSEPDSGGPPLTRLRDLWPGHHGIADNGGATRDSDVPRVSASHPHTLPDRQVSAVSGARVHLSSQPNEAGGAS